MGRGKIDIKKIENKSSRQVTFSKRRAGLFKKAAELSVLCDADIGVIVWNNNRRLFEYTNRRSMQEILDRYNKKEPSIQEGSTVDEHVTDVINSEVMVVHNPPQSNLHALNEEYLKLYKHMRGQDLKGLSIEELKLLETQLFDGIKLVTAKKEHVMKQQLEQSKQQEQKMLMDNEKLRKEVEELRQRSSCSESNSSKRRRIDEVSADKEVDSDDFLRLGLSTTVCYDDKAPKIESTSDESNGQMESG